MTQMQNLQPDLDEQARQDAVYENAMRSISASRTETEKHGYVVMSAAMGWGEGALGDGIFGKVSQAARLFMIAFACALPPVMVWVVLL